MENNFNAQHELRGNSIGIYRGSNVVFKTETMEAFSYDWWQFVGVVNGKIVFNDYNYSRTTQKHQHKVRGTMNRLGIKPDYVLCVPGGLQDIISRGHKARYYYRDLIATLQEKLNSPRRGKHLDDERQAQIEFYQHQLKVIDELFFS